MTRVHVYRGDVQRTAVADTAGARRQSVRLSPTSTSRPLRRHVLPSEISHARRHMQQPPQPDARSVAVSAVETAATAIRKQLQLSCRSVLSMSIYFIFITSGAAIRDNNDTDIFLIVKSMLCTSFLSGSYSVME